MAGDFKPNEITIHPLGLGFGMTGLLGIGRKPI